MFYLLTIFLFYPCLKYVTCRFITIKKSKVFSLDFWKFIVIICFFFFTKPRRSGILLLTSLIFVSKITKTFTKPLLSGVFYQHHHFFLQILFFCFVLIYANQSSCIKNIFIYITYFCLQYFVILTTSLHATSITFFQVYRNIF